MRRSLKNIDYDKDFSKRSRDVQPIPQTTASDSQDQKEGKKKKIDLKDFLNDFLIGTLRSISSNKIIQWTFTTISAIFSLLASSIILVNVFDFEKLLTLGPARIVMNIVNMIPIQVVAFLGYIFALITKMNSDSIHIIALLLIGISIMAYGIKHGLYLMILAAVIILANSVIQMGLLNELLSKYEMLRQLYSFLSLLTIGFLVADLFFSYAQNNPLTYKKAAGLTGLTVLEQINNLG